MLLYVLVLLQIAGALCGQFGPEILSWRTEDIPYDETEQYVCYKSGICEIYYCKYLNCTYSSMKKSGIGSHLKAHKRKNGASLEKYQQLIDKILKGEVTASKTNSARFIKYPTEQDKVFLFRCISDDCKTFSLSRSSIQSHYRKKHIHKKHLSAMHYEDIDTLYQCGKCLKNFEYYAQWATHLSIGCIFSANILESNIIKENLLEQKTKPDYQCRSNNDNLDLVPSNAWLKAEHFFEPVLQISYLDAENNVITQPL